MADKPKPYTVLTVVEAESGSWSYEIRVSHRTGLTYCSCPGYGFHKKCKHLTAYNENPITVALPKTAAVTPTRIRASAILKRELAKFGFHATEDICTTILSRLSIVETSEADTFIVAKPRVIRLAD